MIAGILVGLFVGLVVVAAGFGGAWFALRHLREDRPLAPAPPPEPTARVYQPPHEEEIVQKRIEANVRQRMIDDFTANHNLSLEEAEMAADELVRRMNDLGSEVV